MLGKIFNVIFYTPHRAIFLYRISSWFYKRNLIRIAYILKHINITLNGCDISPAARIGKNPMLCHSIGIVIGEGVVIGDNLRIYQNVTLGTKDGYKAEYPIIGDNVTLFAGSVIAGSVLIGNNSTVGANSLVLKDVPQNSVAMGVPAIIKIEKGVEQIY